MRPLPRTLLAAAAALAGSPLALGCIDETHDEAVVALGPEDPGVPTGPEHRPGQPCLVCHGGIGPAHEQFSIAGTIYAVQGQSAPAVGASVRIEDITGSIGAARSNAAGNFYITPQDWTPTYPVLPEVTLGDITEQMTTHVNREGSCGACHADPPGPTSAGRVYVQPSTAKGDGGP